MGFLGRLLEGSRKLGAVRMPLNVYEESGLFGFAGYRSRYDPGQIQTVIGERRQKTQE